MFNSENVLLCYKNLIGWKQHHDTDEVDVSEENQQTESGEYFQQKHAAMRLDYIQSLIPRNYDLNKYLKDVVEESTNEMFNDLIQYRQVKDYGKTLLENGILLNRQGFSKDRIVNQSRFVGYQVRMFTSEGLKMLVKQIGFQFAESTNFDLYIYHTSQSEPIKTITVELDTAFGWQWKDQEIEFSSWNKKFHEGMFFIGYYQDDIGTQAINCSNFNFDKGECGSCNSRNASSWRNVSKYFHIYPIYVPNGSFEKGKMFDVNEVFYVATKCWGLNLNLSVVCDLTDFFCDNKFAFKNLLAWKVVHKVMNMMKFSDQINYVEENLKMMIIRDLEGDKETNFVNIPQEYQKELKAVDYNISKINQHCLGCNHKERGPKYGVV